MKGCLPILRVAAACRIAPAQAMPFIAGPHKSTGHITLVAGCRDKVAHGRHLQVNGAIGDLYLTLTDQVLGADLGKYPTASRKITEVLA